MERLQSDMFKRKKILPAPCIVSRGRRKLYDSVLSVNEGRKLRLLATGGRTCMLSRNRFFGEPWKVCCRVDFMTQPLESIEGLPANQQVARKILSATTERNKNVIVGPVGHVFGQPEISMMTGIRAAEESLWRHVMHFGGEPFDYGFVG